MLKREAKSGQGLAQGDGLAHGQVGLLALENFMLFFDDCDDEVASCISWPLIALAMEIVSMLVWSSFVYLDFNDFTLFKHAFRVHVLPCPLAFITRSALLYHHTWAHLPDLVHYTTTAAFRAGNHLGAFAAILLNSISLDCDFGGFAIV